MTTRDQILKHVSKGAALAESKGRSRASSSRSSISSDSARKAEAGAVLEKRYGKSNVLRERYLKSSGGTWRAISEAYVQEVQE
jgi:hypothetical protein